VAGSGSRENAWALHIFGAAAPLSVLLSYPCNATVTRVERSWTRQACRQNQAQLLPPRPSSPSNRNHPRNFYERAGRVNLRLNRLLHRPTTRTASHHNLCAPPSARHAHEAPVAAQKPADPPPSGATPSRQSPKKSRRFLPLRGPPPCTLPPPPTSQRAKSRGQLPLPPRAVVRIQTQNAVVSVCLACSPRRSANSSARPNPHMLPRPLRNVPKSKLGSPPSCARANKPSPTLNAGPRSSGTQGASQNRLSPEMCRERRYEA